MMQIGAFHDFALPLHPPPRPPPGACVSGAHFANVVAGLHKVEITALFNVYVYPDAKDPAHYVTYLGQGGLGLPSRDYYLDDTFAETKAAYLAHIRRTAEVFGEDHSEARTRFVFFLGGG